jgi:hypothetical protein
MKQTPLVTLNPATTTTSQNHLLDTKPPTKSPAPSLAFARELQRQDCWVMAGSLYLNGFTAAGCSVSTCPTEIAAT